MEFSWQRGWRKLTRVWGAHPTSDVEDEIQFHFENKVAEFVAEGMSVDAANVRARAEFGDVDGVRQSLRSIDARILSRQRRAEWWENFAQDTRYVIRSLKRAPLFTAMVLLTLSLGLGANAALFSLIDRVFVQTPEGVHEGANSVQRVYLREQSGGRVRTKALFNYPQLRSLAELAPSGLTVAGYSVRGLPEMSIADPSKLWAVYVVGDYFGVLGVTPVAGRFFTSDESKISGLSLTAVISYDLWTRRYQRNPSVIGETINIGAHRHQIVGVAPPGFHGADVDNVDVWAPQNSRGILRGRAATWYEKNYRVLSLRAIARVPSEGAANVFGARATALMRKDPLSSDSLSQTFLGSLVQSRVDGSQSSQLKVSTRLAGVSLLILIIACANVVNLLLARASSREREIAVRIALGVGRRRLVLQLMLESLVLGITSGLLALSIAYAGAAALQRLLFPNVRFAGSVVDVRTVIYTMLIAVITSVVTGLVPALQFSRPDISRAMKSGIRDGGPVKSLLRSSMLVAQVALSLILLAGAGVFVRSMQNVEELSIGFDADRLLFAQVDYNPEEGDHHVEFEARLPEAAERVRRIPGVESVALADGIPFLQSPNGLLFLPAIDSAITNADKKTFRSVVSAEYFKTAGIKVIQGRAFTTEDQYGSEPVIIINQRLAQQLWPRQNPLSKCVVADKRNNACRRVVGVVAATRDEGVTEDPPMKFYLPLPQLRGEDAPDAIAIRADPKHMAAVQVLVAQELSELYGATGVPSFESIDRRVQREMHSWQMGAALFGAAGLLALLVAAVGVYSSIAYTVGQRNREMGVRVALGASSGSILGLIVREGVQVVAAGAAIGLVLALALGSLVASLLYQTSPRDPLVLTVSTVTLLAVAVVACSVPAWRASRVDPLNVLRGE